VSPWLKPLVTSLHLIKARLYCRYELCVGLAGISYNKSIVVSLVTEQYCSFVSVCVAYSSIGIFRCDFVPFEFSSVSHSEMRLLLSTCASLYCFHAKQIKEDLDDIE